MWTPTARRHHSRTGPQYDINLTDAEWVIMGLCCNPPLPRADDQRCGRCAFAPWRHCVAAPAQGPAAPEHGSGYFSRWRDEGVFRRSTPTAEARCSTPQPANVQDRDGAVPILKLLRRSFPFVSRAFADAAYAGDSSAITTLVTIEIIRKPPYQVGFAVYFRRWVVERSYA